MDEDLVKTLDNIATQLKSLGTAAPSWRYISALEVLDAEFGKAQRLLRVHRKEALRQLVRNNRRNRSAPPHPNESMKNDPVGSLEFRPHTKRALAGITTIGELIQHTEDELRHKRQSPGKSGFGWMTVNDIKIRLNMYGFRLRGEENVVFDVNEFSRAHREQRIVRGR
jgi:hypothetical protein